MVQFKHLFVAYLCRGGATSYALEIDDKDEQARLSALERPPALGDEIRGLQ